MSRPAAGILPAVVLVLALAAGPAAAYWQPIQQLTDATDNCNFPAIGRGLAVRDSFAHIVYANRMSEQWRLFYLRSTDRGESWDAPVMLDDALEGFTFSVAADGAGGVHFINRRPGGVLRYRRSTDNGASWLSPVTFSGGCETPLLLTDDDRHIYVIDIAGSLDAGLYLRRSTDGGENWGSPRLVASQSGFSGLCAAATPGGRIHVAWGYGPSGESHVYHVRSTDRGESWAQVQRVSTTSRVMPWSIWTGAGDEVLLAFTRYQGPQNFRRSSDAGRNWSSETTLAVLLSACVADTFEGIHALGVKDETRVLYLRSASRGARWTGAVDITGPEPGTRSRPQLAIDERADLYAAWNSRQTGQVQVYLRRGVGMGGAAEPGQRRTHYPPRLHPNPVRFSVHLDGAARARLYDRRGAEVARLGPGVNDLSRFPDGVYFAVLEPGPAAGPVKLVKTSR
ncbi:MAG TPA: exo-alpha-sialidase [candidate division WOR-3 bacterium]|uniref:Exo-alpha-sialidase n=1 Tax=candidate division WOR-3 bacterium TaxID=2052148 RepID=A0A7V0XFW1_UNCW3|nr:exo-alpha-sialidase [candidate division WOR-3 bacterium]